MSERKFPEVDEEPLVFAEEKVDSQAELGKWKILIVDDGSLHGMALGIETKTVFSRLSESVLESGFSDIKTFVYKVIKWDSLKN